VGVLGSSSSRRGRGVMGARGGSQGAGSRHGAGSGTARTRGATHGGVLP
jgi:hypothetical protein